MNRRRYVCFVCVRGTDLERDHVVHIGAIYLETNNSVTLVCTDCERDYCALSVAERARQFNISQFKGDRNVVKKYIAALECKDRVERNKDTLFVARCDALAKNFVGKGARRLLCYSDEAPAEFTIGAVRLLSRARQQKLIGRLHLANWCCCPQNALRHVCDRFDAKQRRALCTHCSRLEDRPFQYKRCDRCIVTYYCSREHQIADWKYHKHECCKLDHQKRFGFLLLTVFCSRTLFFIFVGISIAIVVVCRCFIAQRLIAKRTCAFSTLAAITNTVVCSRSRVVTTHQDNDYYQGYAKCHAKNETECNINGTI